LWGYDELIKSASFRTGVNKIMTRFVFKAAAASSPGIYLWTVDTKDGHLIYYVGETGSAFRQRVRQHWCAQMAGMYHIYDLEQFALGHKHVL
jgi:hypothetical protein